MGLVKGHYFINGYTELTPYSSENYEEAKDIKDCNQISNKYKDKYKKCNDRFIKAFQSFKMLMGNVDKLFTPIELTDEILNTQFYYKVNDYKTLEYNLKKSRLETYEEKSKTNINYSLILKPLRLNINTCHIYVGFTMMIYNKNL